MVDSHGIAEMHLNKTINYIVWFDCEIDVFLGPVVYFIKFIDYYYDYIHFFYKIK